MTWPKFHLWTDSGGTYFTGFVWGDVAALGLSWIKRGLERGSEQSSNTERQHGRRADDDELN